MSYFDDVKREARGKWIDVFIAAGYDANLKKDVPCPFCSPPGKEKSNRFCVFDATKGAWKCRQCNGGRELVGDGFEFIKKFKNLDTAKAFYWVGDLLGVKRIVRDREFPEQQVITEKSELGKLWEECTDQFKPDSPFDKYWKKRGITPFYSTAVGYHPTAKFVEEISGVWKERKVPAIVLEITTADGTPDGLEVIYITKDGDKLPVDHPKKLFKFKDKFADGVTIKFDEAVEELVIAEGPELGQYAREVLKKPTWSAMNAGMLKKARLPHTLKRLWIVGDNDSSGTGQNCAWDLAERYMDDMEVRVLLPQVLDKGWDDLKALSLADLDVPIYQKEDRYPEVVELTLPSVMPFEYHFLPECAQEQTARIAENLYAPVDYVAMSVFVALGFLIGTRCAVRPKVLDEWFPVPNFYGALVGDASTLKTPVILTVLAAIFKFEVAAREKWDKEMLDYKVAMASYKNRVEGLQQSIKSAKDEEKARQQSRLNEAIREEPPVPILKRYAVNTVTTPKLIAMLNQNPRGLLSWHDELTAPLGLWEDPRNIADKTFMLKCWAGTARHTDDTKSGGDNFADPACLSFFGGIQTDKLQRYIMRVVRNGSDGLLARLQLMTFPDDLTGYVYRDTGENKEEKHRLFKVMEFIDDCDFVKLGAIEHPKRPYFGFNVEAQEVFKQWFTELIRNRVPNERKGLMREHLSKYRSLMPTLALVIHVADLADAYIQDQEAQDGRKTFKPGPITKMAAEKAILLCDYLESHARRVYSLSGGDQQHAAMVLAGKIVDRKIEDDFTRATISQKGWSDLQDKLMIEAATDRLVGAKWLFPTETAGRGRHTTKYKINPRVWKLKEVNQC